MQIAFGGGEAAMAEDFLHMTEIGFALQEMRGARVTPQMASDVLASAATVTIFDKSNSRRH